MELENWFKVKKYPHIGLPITIKDYKWVKDYVEDSERIRVHSFLPYIHKSIIKRKYRADPTQSTKNPSGKRKRKVGKIKVRDIFYASHLDSLIFSKYNEILVAAYEDFISDKPFNECIVAYRKIPISKGSKSNKCNIDFAKTAFEYIQRNSGNKLTVIIADITSFFDNLNHKTLKKQWSKVLEKKSLPEDHYNVFKALTNKRYIKGEQLFEYYNNTMLVECGIPNNSTGKIRKRKKIKNSIYFKEKKAIAYCEKSDFIKNNLSLIISDNSTKGIPQGSPISATLANVYMLDFDTKVFNIVASCNGFYQRYSDDLIIICEQEHENELIKCLRQIVQNDVQLEIG